MKKALALLTVALIVVSMFSVLAPQAYATSVGSSEKGILRKEWKYDMRSLYGTIYFGSSPAIANLLGGPDLEIVTGSDEYGNYYPELGYYAWGIWRCFDSQGTLLWAKDTGTDESRSSPVIADINQDGYLEIVGGTTSGWNVEAMDRFGNFIWTFPWPPTPGGPFMWHSSPAVADVDPSVSGLEVFIGNNPYGGVWALDGDNSDGVNDGITATDWWIYGGTEGIHWDVLWAYPTGSSVVSSPALGDIDKDGQIEVVIGSMDGKVYVLNGITGALEWSYSTGGGVASSAAIANLDGDSYLEVVIGSSDGKVYCLQWNGSTGSVEWIFPTFGGVYSSPAIGDIDGDGHYDVVVGSDDGKVYALNADGSFKWSYPTGGAVRSSAALANRGTTGLGVYIGSYDDYLYLIDGSTGTLVDRFLTYGDIYTSPSVADVDGDGKLEIFFYDASWSLYRYTFWALEDTGSTASPYLMEWPMFRHDPYRTGLYIVLPPPTPPPELKIGDIVETTDYLKVRDITDWTNPLNPGNILFTMPPPYKERTSPPNNVGKVIDGPRIAGGYIWWKIEWDNNEKGWSAEGPVDQPGLKYLVKSDKPFIKFRDIEDPFNYQGQYTLDVKKLTSKENEAIKYVMAYAKTKKISPALIMAIISWESNFDAGAKGDYRTLYKDEFKPTSFGYMQVRWPAAFDSGFRGKERKIEGELEDHYKWFNEKCEIIWGVKPTLEKFFAYLDWPDQGLDPETNIRYGTTYIKLLYDKIKKGVGLYIDVYGDILKSTISAYNRGYPWLPNRVDYVLKVLESTVTRGYRGYRHYLSIRNEKQPLSTIEATSPVDLIITDPDNLTITKEIGEIPGVLYYIELDIDEDGELDDMIIILERKIGDYLISVIPEPDAAPTDTYTLKVLGPDATIVLAENVPISDVPTEPYIFNPTTLDIPPTTLLDIGEPKFVVNDITYLTSVTPIALIAEDNPGGSGVASTAYRIYNATYNSGWITYTQPFYLIGLSDGTYHIDYNSTDNAGNVEPTSTVTVILDNTPPTTTLTIGEPKYVTDVTYVTLETPFTLEADDDAGSGVYSIAYRIYNSTYDSDWLPYTAPFYLTALADGAYTIEFNSTDNVGNVEPTNTATIILDNTGPSVAILNPPSGWALQDGVTFIISAIDTGSGVSSLNLSIREANGDEGTPVGFEDLPATYNAATGNWTLFFDTLQLPDGYYVVLVKAEDNLGNIGSVTVPYSIRNWAVIELLPASETNKAGRTMPVKFSLRVAASVDPDQPFVYNEELTIKIYATNDPSNILQTSTFGDTSRDYRINTVNQLYITNFQTLKTPMLYTVSVYRGIFLIDSFNFKTVK